MGWRWLQLLALSTSITGAGRRGAATLQNMEMTPRETSGASALVLRRRRSMILLLLLLLLLLTLAPSEQSNKNKRMASKSCCEPTAACGCLSRGACTWPRADAAYSPAVGSEEERRGEKKAVQATAGTLEKQLADFARRHNSDVRGQSLLNML